MAYVPDPTDVTQPTGSVLAQTAAAEFRALKAYIKGLVFGANPVGSSGIKNRLIGGDFSSNPWQRGITGDGTAFRYIPDRWDCVRAALAAGATFSRQASGDAGYQYDFQIQRDNGNAGVGAIQTAYSFETKDSLSLAGKTVTLSVRGSKGANLSGTATISVVCGTGTDQNALTGFTGATLPIGIDLAAGFNSVSYTTISATGVIPANTTQVGLIVTLGPTGTAGAADFVHFDIIQLEESPAFTG